VLPRIERVVPDSGFAHALAFCLAVEDAYDVPVPAPVAGLRSALLELERIHNHLHAVAAMCAAGGLIRQAAEARDVRRRILRLNHELCGHRLLRGAVVPGGIRLARVPTQAHIWSLESAATELTRSVVTSPTLRETYQGRWTLTNSHAALTGVLGFVGRASGIDTDARREHPFHPAPARVPSVTSHRGDALARLRVRAGEIDASFRLLRELVSGPSPAGDRSSQAPALPGGGGEPVRGLGLVEGPRGTIVHRVVLHAGDRVESLRMVDPSFLNRSVFTLSQRGPHDEHGSMVASGFDVPFDRAVGP
jgi:Ni,Fe-hydrogenase III large subunit